MKKNLILLLFFLLTHLFSSGQSMDSVGYNIVEKQLNIIKDYLDNPNLDSTLKRVAVIGFLTDLTGITSESDGNYIGQLSPTKNDYVQWKRWLILNKENIYWDKNSENLVIHKELKPPKFK